MPEKKYTQRKRRQLRRPQPTWRRAQEVTSSFQRLGSTVNRTLIGVIILACVLFILYAPFIRISTIDFVSDDTAYRDQINGLGNELLSRTAFGFIPLDNYFLFDEDVLSQAFVSHPFITHLSVQKKFPQKIIVSYELREPRFVLQTKQSFFTLDSDGYILAQLTQKESVDQLPVIVSEKTYQVGTQSDLSSLLPALALIHAWFDKYPATHITYFTLDQYTKHITAVTDSTWEVYFDASQDIERQLQTLASALAEIEQHDTPLRYIDLRIGNWVYYQ